MQCLDLDTLNDTVLAHRERFATAEPFPHAVLDGLLHPEVAAAVVREFDAAADGWTFFQHFNEKKVSLNDPARMGPASRALIADLQSEAFVRALERGGQLLTSLLPVVCHRTRSSFGSRRGRMDAATADQVLP